MADESTVPGVSSVMSSEVAQNVDKRLTSMFVRPEAIVGVQSTFTHVIEPLRAVSPLDEQFDFDLPTTNGYVDLKNMQLYIRGRLTKRDGTHLTGEDKVSVTNNLLHSLFQSVTVYVGHNQLELYSSEFPYKAYIRQLQKYDGKKPTSMLCEGFLPEDCSRVMDGNELKSASSRAGMIMVSRTVELMGETLIDLFQTDSYLMPACPLRIKYRKNRDGFYVITLPEGKDQEYNFSIEKISLHAPTISVAPSMTPLLEMQTDGAPAAYNFEALGIKQFPLSKDSITRHYSRVFEGRLPSRVLVTFFDQSAFSGVGRDKNPLMTSDVNVRSISLCVNGVGLREVQVNYGERIFMEAYQQFIKWMNKKDKEYMVTAKNFPNGFRFYAFDLRDNCGKEHCLEETLTQGYIDLKLDLHAPHRTEDCVMTVYYFSPQTVFINKQRVAQLEAAVV